MIEYVVRAAFVYYAVKLDICLAFRFYSLYSVNMGGVIEYDEIQTINEL